MEKIFRVIELLGTAAFAVSGAAKGIDRDMDVFGVLMMGLITATCGGIIRDAVLGAVPPAVFFDPVVIPLALAAAAAVFVSVRRHGVRRGMAEWPLICADSLGLAIFSVAGVKTAYACVEAPGAFLLVFVGAITGVGGGVLSDVLCGNVPQIFVKHFYACSSIIGSALCAFLWRYSPAVAMPAGAAVILVLRLLAARFRWDLPKARKEG